MGDDSQNLFVHDIDAMYKDWFLDYASYVILDRAIPGVDDGLKPVQRRLLHALQEMEDGRFNKAANVIGHTMRYHPHGDMAISEALVKLAQKGLLIETQGNWGNPLTGDQSAAPRYIEARLTTFAKEVLFNASITEWEPSYDGRAKEPRVLPTKFPLLLFLGAEGIAVGLATKILPHNFCELVKESIAILRGYKPQLVPDFPGGGIADYSDYQDGKKGSRIKVRAKIEVSNSRLLIIRELPFGTTTSSLIDSILAANDKGVVKIKKIEDNTAADIEIAIHLPTGASPDQTIAGLYAFTDCEVSLTPNCCVIANNKPLFCGISDLLVRSTNRTKELLRQELEHERKVLQDKLHMALLEKVFVEQRVYRKIEGAESWESVLAITAKAFKSFKDVLFREASPADLEKVLELRIKRIAKYDLEKTDAHIKELRAKLAEVENHLANLNAFAIAYFKELLKKYGKAYPRKTEISSFAPVSIAKAAATNLEVFLDRKEGFIGTSLKGHESLGMASEFSEMLSLAEDGTLMVHRVCDKMFVGKSVLYAGLFTNDERCVYHLIYRDGRDGPVLAKRFTFTSYIRNKMYQLTKDTKGSKVLYFSVHPNGEAEKVQVNLKATPLVKGASKIEVDFSQHAVKARTVVGTEITKNKVESVVRLLVGASTLQAQRVWFDRKKNTLNADGDGVYLGKYSGSEQLIAVYSSGSYEVIPFDWNYHFSPDLLDLKFLTPKLTVTVQCTDGKKDKIEKSVELSNIAAGRYDFVPRRPNLEVSKVKWS